MLGSDFLVYLLWICGCTFLLPVYLFSSIVKELMFSESDHLSGFFSFLKFRLIVIFPLLIANAYNLLSTPLSCILSQVPVLFFLQYLPALNSLFIRSVLCSIVWHNMLSCNQLTVHTS